MKWIFLLAICCLIPVATNWLRSNPHQMPKALWLLGFMQFVGGLVHLEIAPISWAMWPGFVKGLEVSVIDALALAILLSSPQKGRFARFQIPFLLYVIVALLSALQSTVPMPAVFYAWQLFRIALVATAVAQSCRTEKTVEFLVLGLAMGLALQAVFSAKDYAGGAVQAGGSFGHQNLLGMLTHFVVFPSLALLLAGSKRRLLWIGPLSGVLVAVFTASRGTIGFAAGGFAALLILSMVLRPTARKSAIVAGSILTLLVATPIAYSTLSRRFDKALVSDYDERAALERSASAMLRDHAMGVGANHYVVTANSAGYSDRAGVAPTFSSRGAHVHNAFLLAAAETGYLGLMAFMVMMLWPIVSALRNVRAFKRDARTDILLGLAVALSVVFVHSMFEWIFVTYNVQYLFGICAGLVVAISRQLRTVRKPKSAPREPAPLRLNDSLESAPA